MYLENDVRLAPRRTKPRVSSNAKKGPIPVWSELLDSLDLPDFNQLMDSPWSRTSWKKHVKCLLHTNALLSHQLDCSHLPISQCSFELDKPTLVCDKESSHLKRVETTFVNDYWWDVMVWSMTSADSESDAFLLQTTLLFANYASWNQRTRLTLLRDAQD